jgi:hypothetical protein
MRNHIIIIITIIITSIIIIMIMMMMMMIIIIIRKMVSCESFLGATNFSVKPGCLSWCQDSALTKDAKDAAEALAECRSAGLVLSEDT